MANDVVIYVADSGSVNGGNYHWVCSRALAQSSSSPEDLAQSIASDLASGVRVVLGYESPLFVPCRQNADKLGKARQGECTRGTGNRPWNASAGARILATGIQSLAWVLRRIKELNANTTATTSWEVFQAENTDLFLWEAFVSGSEKAVPASHVGDAILAIQAFQTHRLAGDMPSASRIQEPDVFSLVGAAILFAGLSTEVELLKLPCVVLRPNIPPDEAEIRITQHKQRLADRREAKKQADRARLDAAVQAKLEELGHGE